MNTADHDEIDVAVRSLPFLSDDEVRLRSDDSARRALLQEVLMSDPAPTRSRWLRRRTAVVGGALAAVLVGGGVVAATADVFTSGTQLYAGCLIQAGDAQTVGEGFSDRRLGQDPVADCQEEWTIHVGTDAPPMTAYVDAEGQVSVIPDGWKVPDGLEKLPAGVVPDTTAVQQEAERDDSHGTPALVEGFPELEAYADRVEAECLTVPAAAALLDEMVVEKRDWVTELDQIEDSSASCTSITVMSGGAYWVTLTGPMG